jgi:hypothetical protein
MYDLPVGFPVHIDSHLFILSSPFQEIVNAEHTGTSGRYIQKQKTIDYGKLSPIHGRKDCLRSV